MRPHDICQRQTRLWRELWGIYAKNIPQTLVWGAFLTSLFLFLSSCSTTTLNSTTTTVATTSTNITTTSTSTTTTIIPTTITTNTTSTTTTTTTSTTTTTIAGCYIGAFVNGLSNTPTFETSIERNLAVNMWYISWSNSFPSSDCDTVNNYGGIPMITWEPQLSTTGTLDAIANGNYDSYITTFAQTAKSWGKLIYLRFAHEMNGNWYPWDGYHNGGPSSPAKYILAWRHIYNIFASVEATNVKFVWSPNHESVPDEAWNKAEDYYPGDSYVDWIGMDGYNFGQTNWSNWRTFYDIFNEIYSSFQSYNKPMMIAEFASATDEVRSKANWITDAFYQIKNNYPKIRLFNWFNIEKYEATAGKVVDWRANSSTDALNSFKTAISDNYFLESPPTD